MKKIMNDNTISLKAKGLYAILKMKEVNNEKAIKSELLEMSKDGRDAFQNAWNELKKSGYMIQHKEQNKQGSFQYQYELNG